jgi:hypothetical protein
MDSRYLADCAADNRSLETLLTPVLESAIAVVASAPRDVTPATCRCAAPGIRPVQRLEIPPSVIPPPKGTESAPLQILDLACGSCREMESVSSALRIASARPQAGVRLVGADIRVSHVDEARDRARKVAVFPFESEFLLEDCTKLDRHAGVGHEFDLVFVRHQNFWHDPRSWWRIFSAGLERLHGDGVMVITSYFDREHALAVKAIGKAGGELLADVRNPRSRALATPGKSVDRHLAVFRRRGMDWRRVEPSAGGTADVRRELAM